MPIKVLLLGGGVLGFLERGGGSANFIFMGVGIFPIRGPAATLFISRDACSDSLGWPRATLGCSPPLNARELWT